MLGQPTRLACDRESLNRSVGERMSKQDPQKNKGIRAGDLTHAFYLISANVQIWTKVIAFWGAFLRKAVRIYSALIYDRTILQEQC